MKLNAENIRNLRNQDASAVVVELVAETGSTNLDLMQRLAEFDMPVLRIAERQTAGRGRAGRSWHSADGESLTFSLAWHFELPPQQLLGLSLVVGVAVTEVLLALGVPVSVKWPNDILKDQKKLAGILIEISHAAPGSTWAVIGIGVNLLAPDALEQDIGHAVADAPWLAQMERSELMAALLNVLAGALTQFAQAGFAPFAPRWNAHHAYANQSVQIIDAGRVVHEGIALGVDETGRLLLRTAKGQIAALAGDVSLRPLTVL